MRRRPILKALSLPAALAAGAGWFAWASERSSYYEGPASDHFDGLRFFNPGYPWSKSPADLFRAFALSDKEAWPEAFPSPFADKPPARVEGTRLRVTLVGHATVLIQTGGLNLLTDPVWSARASPLPFAGPKRVNPPGIAFDDLPLIDVVLVTHNHYDHLDLATLARLAAAHRPRVITPLGNDAIMRAAGAAIRVEAYDWGTRLALTESVRVHVEPALHWSARGLADRRKALWAAFAVEAPGGTIYHVGDTGYGGGEMFAAARRKFGAIRLAILPIGAYEPRWFMRDQHMNPEEAVAAFEGCGAAYGIGHHWGTFRLTAEGIERPVEALRTALARHAIAPDRFRAFRPGEAWEVSEV